MENNYLIFTIINTIAIIFIPIIAVIVGQFLQKKQNQRDDKIQIFKILMKDRLTVENPTDTDRKKIDIEKYKLLEVMAKSLNYDISWETIQNPYFPQGMLNTFLQQQNYQNMQTQVIAKFNDLLNNSNEMKI